MGALTTLLKSEPIDVPKAETDDQRFFSVTTILKVLHAEGLVRWQMGKVAEAAVAARNSLATRVEEDGEKETIKWLTGAPYRSPKGERSAADKGTAFHAAAEELALTGRMPDVEDDIKPFVIQLDRWLQKAQPEFLAAEMTVYDTRYGFAGTADGIFKLGGATLGFDWKTHGNDRTAAGKLVTPYPDNALQLSAYFHAEMAATWRARRTSVYGRRYYLLGQTERDLAVPVPPVDGHVVVNVTPERAEAYPVRADDQTFEVFLFCLELARWQYDLSRDVVGDPLVFPEREAIDV